jgi:predicted esterase
MTSSRTFRRAALILLVGSMAAGSAAAAQDSGRGKSRPSRRDEPASAKTDASRSLLANGGFEDGKGTPEGWVTGAPVDGVQYLWDKKVAHSGKSSLCLKKTARRYFPIAQWSQEVPLSDSPASVKVGAWIKAQRTTKATLDVQFLNGDGEMISHKWAAYVGAKEANDPPVTHDWKWYEDVVPVPAGTKRFVVAPQIYGPGTVWFDDVIATAVAGAAKTEPAAAHEASPDDGDLADVPSVERTAGGDAQKRYFLIGPVAKAAAPARGYRLLIILPGGDGSADFNPFIRRIAKQALPAGYLVAQPVAIKWQPSQSIVWPIDADKLPGQKFSTEDFVDAVIADVERTRKLDPRYLFVLGWSSGGHPAYAIPLRPRSRVTGSFVAMSSFPGSRLPGLDRAKGHAYYLLHSPQDFIPIRMAESARDTLIQRGAKVALQTYEGGHGWHGDVFGNIRAGVLWLEEQQGKAPGG